MLDRITIQLRNTAGELHPVYVDVHDNSLSRKWLGALNHLLTNNYHLEKNYCFFGLADSARTPAYILDQVNQSIAAINSSDIGYAIEDFYSLRNTMEADSGIDNLAAGHLRHERMNQLHRYFEELQGTHQHPSPYYLRADAETRWHIRQLNLLCHEFESLVLSVRKKYTAPMWQRPSQLMCWLQAPRFALDEQDYDLFGIDTLSRPLGGVFVGVNKAVGKHHWEVFCDEGRDSRVDELTTTSMRAQTLAAGDFDIEWANNPGEFPWMIKQIAEFRGWLRDNDFDPDDKSLTIGHPQVAQVDIKASFGTTEYSLVWATIGEYADVYSVSTSTATATYDYHWRDVDFKQRQIAILR